MSASCPSALSSSSPAATIALGAGCYWGTEKYVKVDFQKRFPNSIKSARVGFMSTDPDHAMANPTYRDVCSGETGFVEVLQVQLHDEALVEDLIRFFFQFHDPTTANRQGNDVGTQYASVLFVSTDAQKQAAERTIAELQSAMGSGKKNPFAQTKITTLVVPASQFYEAHEEHQEYLEKNPNGYCNHYFRFREWPLN